MPRRANPVAVKKSEDQMRLLSDSTHPIGYNGDGHCSLSIPRRVAQLEGSAPFELRLQARAALFVCSPSHLWLGEQPIPKRQPFRGLIN